MKKVSVATLLCLAVLAINAQTASAHTPFKTALQDAYGLKTVSCYTCHSRKGDVPADKLEAFAENSKAFRNEFGQALYKHMASGDWSAKIAAAKESGDQAAQDKVEAEATEAFKAAARQVIQLKAPSGKTYHEELTAGTLDGVKK